MEIAKGAKPARRGLLREPLGYRYLGCLAMIRVLILS
jgi:hypothetical protein